MINYESFAACLVALFYSVIVYSEMIVRLNSNTSGETLNPLPPNALL